MTPQLLRKRDLSLVSILVCVTLIGCTHNDPYASGMAKFDDEVGDKWVQKPNQDWELFVAHGTITDSHWLWNTQEPEQAVYASLKYAGFADITDVVIHFGDKTIMSPMLFTDNSLGFYIKSSRIPQEVDISWKVNGNPHQVQIDAKSMVELPLVNDSSTRR